MAIETLVPPLPQELTELFVYLLRRDGGSPTCKVSVIDLTSVISGGITTDTIWWGCAEPEKVGPARLVDGFVLYYEMDNTTNPEKSQILLAPDARQHIISWPTGTVRSYAMAAFRYTYRGMFLTAKASDTQWTNLTT